MTDYLQPAPDVPPELVGRLAVMRMSSGSVAVRAGIKEADVLLEINGKPITTGPQLIEVLDALPRDVDVDVLVSRNGQTLRLTARF
jgi:S1-C subfamily serine protease